jgi:Cys-rich protein (TIGR01571 family)
MIQAQTPMNDGYPGLQFSTGMITESGEHFNKLDLYQKHASAYNGVPNQEHVILVQPVVGGHVNVDANGLVMGRWKAGIFNCCTDLVPNSLMACFCPCVALAQVTSRIGLYSYRSVLIVFGIMFFLDYSYRSLLIVFGIMFFRNFGAPLPSMYYFNGWDSYFYDYDKARFVIRDNQLPSYVSYLLIAGLILSIFALALIATIRMKVRTALQIPGGALEDIFYTFFCGCCSLAQIATQVNAYDPGQCSFAPKDTLPGYVHQ